MTGQFEADLALWEQGELSAAAVDARYPGQGVLELTGLWERFSSIASEPTPDPAGGWEALERRLPDRIPDLEDGRGPLRRSVVAAATAALLALGGIAYAAGPREFRDTVDSVVDRIVEVFGGEGRGPSNPPGPEAPRQAPAGEPPGSTSDSETSEDEIGQRETRGGDEGDDDGPAGEDRGHDQDQPGEDEGDQGEDDEQAGDEGDSDDGDGGDGDVGDEEQGEGGGGDDDEAGEGDDGGEDEADD